MKKKKLVTALCAAALIGVIGVGATLAYFTDTEGTNNVITMGHVDIELTEPEFSNNEDNTITNIVPNQVITKDPTITVKAGSESCYLRAKVEIENLDDDKKAELLENINIDEEWWVLNEEDGYYYFQLAVGKIDNSDQKFILFDTVVIPETWGNEVADDSFEIIITAEAIQADNFTPARDDAGRINGWNYQNGDPITAENYEAPVL